MQLEMHFHSVWYPSEHKMWYRETRVKSSHINFHFENGTYRESFYCAIKPGKVLASKRKRRSPAKEWKFIYLRTFATALRVAQLFGLFPVSFGAENPQEIQFRWHSPRTAFSLVFIVCASLTTLMVFKDQIALGPLTAANIIGIIFFSSCAAVGILFLRVTQRLSEFLMRFMSTESILSRDEYHRPVTSKSLAKQVLLGSSVYLVLLTVEHLLSHVTRVHMLLYEKNLCNRTDIDVVAVYVRRHLPYIVNNLPFRYNHFAGFVIEYLTVSFTFCWNFLDLFIILTSIGIASLFEKINWRLSNYRGLFVDESVWEEIRFHHVQVQELLAYVNKLIGEMVVSACFIDGYFMLVQLLQLTS